MGDRWMDERDRRWRDQNRDRDWRRADDRGRGDQRRQAGGEERSWGGSSEDDRGSYGGGGGRGSDRDRVFGERESGMGYGGENRGASGGGRTYRGGGGRYGREEDRPEWQDRHYQGVSPAMQQGEYDLERRAERFQREHPVRRLPGGGYGYEDEGGRYYGDAGREQIYREEWSQGARDTGPAPRGYDADRDHERGHFSEDYEDRMFSSGVASGGTGGYDYERGYGDAGRQRYSEGRFGVPPERGERWEQRGREAGRDTGDFFRRAGERVASWFGGGEREQQQRDWRGEGQAQSRDFRGKGPKGYKRNDERISDEVHERLTDDPYIDASNIVIAVSGGEVTLSGTVEHRDAKHRAERIIEDVSGVSHVQNNLRVTASGGASGESVLDLQARGESGSGETMGGGGGLRSTSAGGESGGEAGSTSTTRPSGASTETGKSR